VRARAAPHEHHRTRRDRGAHHRRQQRHSDTTARRLAEHGASVVVVARRKDRLHTLVSEIEIAGGTALAVQADITHRDQAERAVQSAVDQFGRLDILINNAGLILLGPVVGANVEEWERMIAINQSGLLYVTHAALPHLLAAAQDELRGVADIVNIPSIAGVRPGRTSGSTT
jgi:NADP-dependent 3-hydroxy acid dehydrogenase YdfG